jgi:(p)ppGpp synthase/HD superfamily hydrolase
MTNIDSVDDMIERAFLLAIEAHKGQVDLSGRPYLYHIFYVATHITRKKAMVVAFLHDIVEDTNTTLEDLKEKGFDEEIVAAVEAITKRKSEKYIDFINRVKENSLATEVKLADLKHNIQIKRLKNPTERDLKRIEKYKKARETLRAYNRRNKIKYVSDF